MIAHGARCGGFMLDPQSFSEVGLGLQFDRVVHLPYHGKWVSKEERAARAMGEDFVHRPKINAALKAAHSRRSVNANATSNVTSSGSDSPNPMLDLIASMCMLVHPDSGCTGSMTPERSRLINVKPCSESFSAASGLVAKATCIGDMPIVMTASNGERVLLVLTNVRCVPAFKYTLLSVKQMWREQGIDSRFANINALVLPKGGLHLKFDCDRDLPTIRALSLARVASLGILPDAHAKSNPLAVARADSAERVAAAAADEGALAPPSPLAATRASAPSPSVLPTPRPEPSPPAASTADAADQLAALDRPLRSTAGRSSRPLGLHRVGSVAHIARLPASQASELPPGQ